MFQEITCERAMGLVCSSHNKVPLNTKATYFSYTEDKNCNHIKEMILSNIAFQFAVMQSYSNEDMPISFQIPIQCMNEDIEILRRIFKKVCLLEKSEESLDGAFGYFGDAPPENDEGAVPCFVQVEGLLQITKRALLALGEENQLNSILSYFTFHEGETENFGQLKFYRYQHAVDLINTQSTYLMI